VVRDRLPQQRFVQVRRFVEVVERRIRFRFAWLVLLGVFERDGFGLSFMRRLRGAASF